MVPAPPVDAVPVSSVFYLSPQGASFDPSITFVFKYNPDLIPDGLSEENLRIARWDEPKEQWVFLSCLIDANDDIISTQVESLMIYAIFAMSSPASVSVTDVSLQSNTISPGEIAVVQASVFNAGDMEGSLVIVLNVDGSTRDTKSINIGGKQAMVAQFSISGLVPGVHKIEIGGIIREVTVLSPQEPPVVPPAETTPPAVNSNNPVISQVQPTNEPTPSVSEPVQTSTGEPPVPNDKIDWRFVYYPALGFVLLLALINRLPRRK
jgi:hypothetical protein